MQSGVPLMYTLHPAYIFVSAYWVQVFVLYKYYGERKSYEAQSISSQIYHLVKDITELTKNNDGIWAI